MNTNKLPNREGYTTIESYKYDRLPDTTVLLHNTTTDGEVQKFLFPLHKVYLLHSPFFKTLFKPNTFLESTRSTNDIIFENLDENALKLYFLGHFFKTQVNVFIKYTVDTCIDIRRVADYCNDETVVTDIDEFIKSHITASIIQPLLQIKNSKILLKAVSSFIAKTARERATMEAVVQLPADLFSSVLENIQRRMVIPDMNLMALMFHYLGRLIKRLGEHNCRLGVEMMKKVFECGRVQSAVQRRLLMKFDSYFTKFGLQAEMAELFKCAELNSRMHWHVIVRSDLIKLDSITQTAELSTRDRARVTLQANYKMSLDCPNTYYEVRILEGAKTQNVAFAIGCVGRKFAHRNRQRDRFAEFEEEIVGWRESYGYHSDNGGIYECSGTAVKILKPFGKGDVIGCGREKDHVYFTRNGKLIHRTKIKQTRDNMYPAISMDQTRRRMPQEKHAKLYFLSPSEYMFNIETLRTKFSGYTSYTYDPVFQKYVKTDQALYLDDLTDEVKDENANGNSQQAANNNTTTENNPPNQLIDSSNT